MTRITLSRPGHADIAAITAAMRLPPAVQGLPGMPQPYGMADAEAFVTMAPPDEHAIRVDGAFAGMVRGGPDLGCWLLPMFQGRGIATRAATLALTRRFAAHDGVIGAQVMNGSAPSQAVLARLGFHPVGEVMMQSPTRGTVPGIRYHLTLADFAQAQPLRLTTERCEIAPATITDLPDLYAIATRPEVARMLLLFYPDMPQPAFAETHPAWTSLPPFRCAIRQGGRIIGSVGVGRMDADGLASVFYFLSPEAAGRGIASEVVPAFCDLILDRFGMVGLTAVAFDDNPASIRVLAKAGFVRGPALALSSRGRTDPAPGHRFMRSAGDGAATGSAGQGRTGA